MYLSSLWCVALNCLSLSFVSFSNYMLYYVTGIVFNGYSGSFGYFIQRLSLSFPVFCYGSYWKLIFPVVALTRFNELG